MMADVPSTPHDGTDVPIHLAELEGAHAEVRRAALALELHDEPPMDLEAAAAALRAAFAAIFDAFDGRSDRLEAVHRALGEVDLALRDLERGAELDVALAPMVAHLGRAQGRLRAAQARLSQIAPAMPAEPEDLLASDGTPRLHDVTRRSLAP